MSPPPAGRPRAGAPRRVLRFVAVALGAAVVTLVATADRIPPLTSSALADARGRWARAGIASYRLEIEMRGTELELGTYVVDVRDGRSAGVIRDGRPASGDPSAYSVDGLFGLLEQELQLALTPGRLGAPEGYRVYVFAEFDPARGVPLRFRRVVGGTNRSAEWRVMAFAAR